EVGDRSGNDRLGDSEMLSCLAHASHFDDGQKNVEVAQFETGASAAGPRHFRPHSPEGMTLSVLRATRLAHKCGLWRWGTPRMRGPTMFTYCRPIGVAVITMVAGMITLDGQVAWPQATRTIKIVVPFQPGGTADIVARLLAEEIGRTHGTTMVVENRPGGGSVVGTEAVSRAAPDGNTLLINVAEFAINPHLRKLNYDALTS